MSTLQWRVNTPQLICEMVEGNPSGGALKVPANIFLRLLEELTVRAIALDDPELNVIMLRLNLYNVAANKITEEIEKQQARQ